MQFNELLEIQADIPKRMNSTLIMVGVLVLLVLWSAVTMLFPSPLFPSPFNVLASFKELHFEDALVRNLIYSVKLNLSGYIVAVLISIPLGFAIGLFPLTKGLFNKPIDALRFLPLTAMTGLFINWFGIDDTMKIAFLSFGIIVYLLPTVVLRINETEKVFEQTVRTLGATKWQTIKTVFFPSVLARLTDDIRVLVAISWTYIIVAELVNKTGGVGAMAFTSARQSRIDKVFAILLIIIVVGFIQDKLFKIIDKVLFPHKYA